MSDRDRKDRGGISEWALTFFGLILAIAPLALWVAWTPTILAYILIAAIGGLLICGGLSIYGPSDDAPPAAPVRGPTVTPYVQPDDRGMTEMFRPYNRDARAAYLKLVWQNRRLAGELFLCVLALGGLMLYLAWSVIEHRLLSLMT